MNINTIAKYKSLLENRLSVQERKVLASIVREIKGMRFFVVQIKASTRIFQTNQLHTILGRLVKKGILTKLGRAEYKFKDIELVNHIKNR